MDELLKASGLAYDLLDMGATPEEIEELADWASSQGDALFDTPDYICPAL